MSEDNCGGQCCERFIIEKPMEVIKREYLNWKEACEGTPMVMNGKPELRGTFYSHDIHLIYPMLIDLGEHYFEPYAPEVRTEYKTRHYTCKHYDNRARLCTIYDIRPSMCRNYPYGKGCNFKGCKCYPQKLPEGEMVGTLYDKDEPEKKLVGPKKKGLLGDIPNEE